MKRISMPTIFKNPKYRGKHIILVANKVFTASSGTVAAKILARVRKQYPKATPQVTYLPKAPTLTLWM